MTKQRTPIAVGRACALVLPALTLCVGCEESAKKTAPAAAAAPAKAREVLNKRTQDVRDATKELKTGDAKVATTKIVAKDPITLAGNAYVSIIGQTSILQIQHAVDLYRAEHDAYPKTYEEFIQEIIKANNIALPTLPYYQEYGYDAQEHKLIILEYPAKKENPPE